MAQCYIFLVMKLITNDNVLTNLCNSDIELRKCCGRCFGAVPALRRRESVGFAFLRSDERLYEVGGCLYLRYYRETSGKFEYDGDAEYIIDNVVFSSSHPKVQAIIEDRKKRLQGIRPMCNNVSWENIVSLDLCDNNGQPDVAIV